MYSVSSYSRWRSRSLVGVRKANQFTSKSLRPSRWNELLQAAVRDPISRVCYFLGVDVRDAAPRELLSIENIRHGEIDRSISTW